MRTFRFRIYPSYAQIGILNSTLNLSRELYNAMLQQRIYAYRSGRRVNYNSQQDEIPAIKERFPEYRSIHSLVVQDIARRLDKTYDNFFRRVREKRQGKKSSAGFPRFKSRDRYNSITYPQSGFMILDNGHVWLSRIGEVRMFMHRSVTGKIKTISIKRDSVGDWFITITSDSGIVDKHDSWEDQGNEQPHANSPGFINPVGIDLGLRALITTSDGMQMEPPRFLMKSEKKLKKAQRNLSRKQKGSGKRRKAKTGVAKIHRKIARQRDDFTHKLSRNLVEKHDLIALEGLNIAGMVKNRHLAKSIGDASWNRIIQYTTYKAESAGAVVVLVDPMHTSQKCSKCGSIKDDLKLSDRIYHCDTCKHTMDRDLNAAINIRNMGLIKVGRGTPEFTPVEIGALPVMATPVIETGSPLR
ncbi:MAG: transposase [Candidatus Thermoplasmatota archaeon]|nr:transposase [Candidatus Thermoplasmatota archaeon]